MGATSHDVHVDALLSEMAIGYRPGGFIADMIFPTVVVPKQSNIYTIFSRADRLRQQKTARAPGTEARVITQDVTSGTYYAKNYALKYPVTIEDRANADPIYVSGLYEARAQFILDHLMLDWEIRDASMVTSTTNVGSSSAVGSAWTGSGADPLGDVNTAIDNVHYSTGMHPTDVVFGVEAWKAFRRHSTVRNLIFGTNNGGGYPNQAQVAALLEVQRVHVGGSFQNTGGEGLTESLSRVWGDHCLVYYRPEAPTIERPSFAYNFRWQQPGLPQMVAERHPYNSRTHSEEVEIGYYQDELITGADYAFLVTNVTSST